MKIFSQKPTHSQKASTKSTRTQKLIVNLFLQAVKDIKVMLTIINQES